MENPNEITEYINEIISSIGELTFQLTFIPTSNNLPTIETYEATVHILGDWNGSVSVSMSQDLAESAAKRLLNLETNEEVCLFHVQQFMQEFVNMTGGNLKPVLGERCALSVPKCVESIGFCRIEPEANKLIESDFTCPQGGFLAVQVFEATPDLREEISREISS